MDNNKSMTCLYNELMSNKEEYIDSLEREASLEKAEKHHRANLIFDYCKLEKKSTFVYLEMEICEDCGRPSPYESSMSRYSYCQNVQEFSNFGIGLFLYFQVMKNSIYIMVIMLTMVTTPQIIFGYGYSQALDSKCSDPSFQAVDLTTVQSPELFIGNCTRYLEFSNDTITKMSIELYKVYFHIVLSKNASNGEFLVDPFFNIHIVHVICLWTLFMVNLLIMLLMHTLDRGADLINASPADFATIVRDFELHAGDEQRIIQELCVDGIQPKEVNLIYDIEEFQATKLKYIRLKRLFIHCEENNLKSMPGGLCSKKASKKRIFKEIREIDGKLDRFINDYEEKSDKYLVPVCIAIFEDNIKHRQYLNKFPRGALPRVLNFIAYVASTCLCKCCFNELTSVRYKRKYKLKVFDAPEPEDIIWENLKYGISNRIQRTVGIYLLAFLLIGSSFGVAYGLNTWQKRIDRDSYYESYVISIVVSLVLSVFNYFINLTLGVLTWTERMYSNTQYYLSFSKKLQFALFANTALVPTLVNYLNDLWDSKGTFLTVEILISNAFFIILSNAFLNPFIWFLSPGYYIKLLRRYWLRRHIREYTQKEANEIYENPSIELAYKYAYIRKTELITVFYLPLVPIACGISLFGLIMMYIIEKRLTISMYKRPENINGKISMDFVSNFKSVLFVYSISMYIFSIDLNRTAFISLLLIAACLVIPLNRIMFCDIVEKLGVRVLYEDSYFNFLSHYEIENPVTRKQGNRNYLERIKAKNLLSENEYNLYKAEINAGANLDLKELYLSKSGFKKIGNKTILKRNTTKIFISKGHLQRKLFVNLIRNIRPRDEVEEIREIKEIESDERNGGNGNLGILNRLDLQTANDDHRLENGNGDPRREDNINLLLRLNHQTSMKQKKKM